MQIAQWLSYRWSGTMTIFAADNCQYHLLGSFFWADKKPKEEM
jgi:hypothetical protein